MNCNVKWDVHLEKEARKSSEIKIVNMRINMNLQRHTKGYFGTSPIFRRNEGLCGPLFIIKGFPIGRIFVNL